MTEIVCACGRVANPPRRGMCHRCYERNRYRQNAYGRWDADRVDAAPVRAHVEELIAAGVSRRQICVVSGMPRQTLAVLLRGKIGREPAAWLKKSTADAFLSVPLPVVPHEIAAPTALVPSIGTRRRLQALVSAGWPQASLAAELGMSPGNLTTLLHHQDNVTAWRHRAVCELFERLQMQPGPSERARAHGRKHRWPLPFQWDEGSLDYSDAGPAYRTRREPYVPRTA
ncbi:hypothetical protein [Nocardia sp. NPDC059239]|uniref:hypothetical protein n=1 Tax=unclassified Nocardia TaxID=2637762 RepID=UPI00369BED00